MFTPPPETWLMTTLGETACAGPANAARLAARTAPTTSATLMRWRAETAETAAMNPPPAGGPRRLRTLQARGPAGIILSREQPGEVGKSSENGTLTVR